jgi:hypothetical protein
MKPMKPYSMKPHVMKPMRMPHVANPPRQYSKPPRQPTDNMGMAVKGITDVATLGMLGGVTVGILGAIQK